jgi:hypothetical protein
MADTLDVLTLAEGHTAINLPSANTDHDTELAQQITAVSAILDAEVGCVVQRAVTDEIHDGGGGSLVTNLWPVSTFTTVTDDLAGTPTAITAYRKEPFDRAPALFSGRIELNNSALFTAGRWNVKVTYTAGRYANTAAVAPRFKTCAASVLRRLWKRESGTWAQSPEFFENFDTQAVNSGFYRVAKPIIDELLAYELDRYSYTRVKHYGIA